MKTVIPNTGKIDALPFTTIEKSRFIKSVHERMSILGRFMSADSVEYVYSDRGETYFFFKGGKKLTVRVVGCKVDGGYLTVEEKIEK